MKWQHVLTGCALAASVSSLPSHSHVLHEKRAIPLPPLKGRVAPDAILPIRIALKQSNLHLGYDKLMEVSHPKSDKYGQHMTAEEVHDMFAPSNETLSTVKDWLINSGISESDIIPYTNKGWLALDVPAKDAERLFSPQYFETEASGGYRVGCDEYYLPSHVSKHIDFVKPGTSEILSLRLVQTPPDGLTQRRGEEEC